MKSSAYRLPAELLAAIDEVAARRGVTRTAVVRDALERYLPRAGAGESLVERVDALVRYPGSGVGDLAERGEAHLRKKLRARRRPR